MLALMFHFYFQNNSRKVQKILLKSYLKNINIFLKCLFLKSEAHPSGYLNFFADWEKLSQLIISESYLDTFGDVDIGNNSTIVVEHTSVNPNKALHIGHIRNIIIGDTVSRILKKANYNVNVLNYIDDSGLQVADIIVGFKHFGFAQEPPDGKKFDHYCGDDVYVKTTEKYDQILVLKKLEKMFLKNLKMVILKLQNLQIKLLRKSFGKSTRNMLEFGSFL